MRRLYFAYGSNLAKSQFRDRCPDSRPVAAATLPGYRLRFAGHGHADIVPAAPASHESVAGALYSVSEEDLARLDRYEGVRSGYYERLHVRVRDAGGRRYRAVAYQMVWGHRPAKPSVFYVAIVASGFRQWGLDFDPVLAAEMEAQGVEAGAAVI